MALNTRYIVEVRILDTLNRPKKHRIIGVWQNLDDVPVARIRMLNENAYPSSKVDIKINPYTDINLHLAPPRSEEGLVTH